MSYQRHTLRHLSPALPELWGGIECTVNRVQDRFLDQCEWNGHCARIDDLDRLAALGFRALRYPVLWEKTAPDGIEKADWSWPEERLRRLRDLGIRPIVGLVHHGSGPVGTSLVDPEFPEKLARYARAVAERFPWVEDYTPVNEPLTTARFAGLYGHWYPHGRDEHTFTQALLNQVRATVLAMRAIREVNPAARLVQTEDLGKTWSTPALQYQADHENERRWITWDLLCGRIVPGHWIHHFLTWLGIPAGQVDWFAQNPCPPDVLGVNYYLTSERFLDERIERYPGHTHGGNGRHEYVDVEAVRVVAEGIAGPAALLGEVWERYRLPAAITEAHLGCTREEQMRWFRDVWEAAGQARRAGADVRAVTAWSLLGAFEWNSLLTRCEGHYEPGAFDVRGPAPRPTALSHLIKDLGEGKEPTHPVLRSPGWWRRPIRLVYPPVHAHPETVNAVSVAQEHEQASCERPLLLTGATGTLGRAFARLCEMRGLPFRLLSRREMDIADAASVRRTLDEVRPWAIVNAAGYSRVNAAEADQLACFRENVKGAATLARACAERGIRLVTFSSDLVFDGAKDAPYVESDPVRPLSVYGQSKAEAERRVLQVLPSALVIRAGALFGLWDEHNFVTTALRALASGQTPFRAAEDVYFAPTFVPDLVQTSLDLLIDGEQGIWHLANPGITTGAELTREAARLAGFDPRRIEGRPASELLSLAPRPRWSVLGSERGTLLRPLEQALAFYIAEARVMWTEKTDHAPESVPGPAPALRRRTDRRRRETVAA